MSDKITDWFEAEDNHTRASFDLEEILAFQKEHRVEVLRQEDYQYHCFIDYKQGDGSYAQSFTPLNSMIVGIKQYKNKENADN